MRRGCISKSAGKSRPRSRHLQLSIDAEDLRALPLVQRKRRLGRILPRIESRLMHLDAIAARGTRLYELACARDLEGIVAKCARGTYQGDGRGTSWLKIKNPDYSQMEGRHELFAAKRAEWRPPRTKTTPPALALI